MLAGGFGAIAKDLVQDNAIVLPSIKDNIFNLGFIGVMLVGAFVGFAVDHNPLTSALAGYVGISILNNIIPRDKVGEKRD